YEALGPSRVNVSHTVGIIYGDLVELLRKDLAETGEPVVPTYLFSYDWRQDNRLTAARLGAFISEVIDRANLLRQYAGRCEAVDLVGHSMGGLVIAACLAAGKHRSLSGTGSGQESIVGSIAESIREYTIDPELAKPGPEADLLRQAAAVKVLASRLQACRDLHTLIDGLQPDEVLLDKNGWLPLVGIDEETRFAAGLSVVTHPATNKTRRQWDFLIADAGYDGSKDPASAKEFRLRLGDGVVPLRGSVPPWIARERVVCVAERDFQGFLGLEDVVV